MNRREVIHGEMGRACRWRWKLRLHDGRSCRLSGLRVWCGLLGFGDELENYDDLGSYSLF
jgi:hypothetical protein